MKRTLPFFLIAIFLISSCNAQENKVKLVKQSFEKYKSAILTDKGEEAVEYVDSRTIKYYDKIANLVKDADSAQLSSLPLMDKIMVFTVRHRASKEEILAFDGRGLFIYAVKSGMVSKNSVANNSIGEVTIDKDFAKGKFIANGKESPFYFHFYNENKQWKIDLTSLFSVSIMAIKKMVSESGQDENEYLLSLLEIMTGKKPGNEIWHTVR